MTTVTIVAVSLAALGAFVWSLIPIEEVTGRRQAGAQPGQRAAGGPPGQRAAARARMLASTVARTGRPALDGLADGARSARRQAGVAWERAGAAWERTGAAWERTGAAWERAGGAWKQARRSLSGRAARHAPGGRVRGAHRPRFEQAHDLTGPAPVREDYLPVAGEADSAGSRALAALELILLVVLLGGLVAVAALGGAEIIRHAFSRPGG